MNSPQLPSGSTGWTILFPHSDSYGGHGGIAQYNRDVIDSMAADSRVGCIEAIPRTALFPPVNVPEKARFHADCVGNLDRFIWQVLRVGLFGRKLDLVYCAHINLLPLCALIALVRRVPLVLVIYGLEIWTKPLPRLHRLCLRRVDRLISISRFTLDRFAERADISGIATEIWPNGVDLDAYQERERPQALAQQCGVDGKRVILTLARMPANPTKGFDAMLEAMPDVIKADPDIRYLVAGSGDDMARLQAKCSALGLDDYVQFLGRVDEAQKHQLFALADLFAMPSTGDGFGFVFIEALACGTPVLSSTVDGGYEAIMHGELGRAVDPADHAALVQQLVAGVRDARGVPEKLSFYSKTSFAERVRATISAVIPSA